MVALTQGGSMNHGREFMYHMGEGACASHEGVYASREGGLCITWGGLCMAALIRALYLSI